MSYGTHLGREFGLLQLRIRCHASLAITARKLKHGVVEAVKSGKRYELKLIPHVSQFVLEASDGPFIQIGAPVKRGRTVVREKLAREFAMDRASKFARLVQVGF